MAELATIARPYAEALFRVALPARLNDWSALLSDMAQIAADPGFHSLAGDPRVVPETIRDVFNGLLKARFDVEVGNLIDILTRNRRLELLPEIEQQFRALKNAHESAAEAKIVSAFPISESELGQLITALQKKFGRTLMPSVSVDPTLIGGVCVTIGDEVLDTSVKARLQQMQTVLAA